MGKQKIKRSLCALLGLFGVASAASAEVVAFRNGASNTFVTNYGGTEDTFLNSNTGAEHTGYGALTASLTGRETIVATGLVTYRTALTRFDLSAMQGQYSSINSATLTYYQAETGVQFPDFEFGVHEVSAANGAWVEGTSATGVAGNPDWDISVMTPRRGPAVRGCRRRASITSPPPWQPEPIRPAAQAPIVTERPTTSRCRPR